MMGLKFLFLGEFSVLSVSCSLTRATQKPSMCCQNMCFQNIVYEPRADTDLPDFRPIGHRKFVLKPMKHGRGEKFSGSLRKLSNNNNTTLQGLSFLFSFILLFTASSFFAFGIARSSSMLSVLHKICSGNLTRF